MPSTMHFPAPRRASFPSDRGYTSRPYTLQDIVDVFQYGGYFVQGCHDFAPRMSRVALDGPAKLEENLLRLEKEVELV